MGGTVVPLCLLKSSRRKFLVKLVQSRNFIGSIFWSGNSEDVYLLCEIAIFLPQRESLKSKINIYRDILERCPCLRDDVCTRERCLYYQRSAY